MNAFEYRAPRTLDEALAILGEYGEDARGCRRHRPRDHDASASGAAALPGEPARRRGLGGIEATNGSLRLGALITHRAAEISPLVRERLPVLAETFRRVATVRVRHMATVGGALAHGDPNQDPPVTLLALGARVEIRGPRGARALPLSEFFRDYYETALEPGERSRRSRFPPRCPPRAAPRSKFLPRTADDCPTVAAAAIVTLEPDRERCREARIALGSVGVTPLRAGAAEALLAGQRLGDSLLQAAGEAAKGAIR